MALESKSVKGILIGGFSRTGPEQMTFKGRTTHRLDNLVSETGRRSQERSVKSMKGAVHSSIPTDRLQNGPAVAHYQTMGPPYCFDQGRQPGPDCLQGITGEKFGNEASAARSTGTGRCEIGRIHIEQSECKSVVGDGDPGSASGRITRQDRLAGFQVFHQWFRAGCTRTLFVTVECQTKTTLSGFTRASWQDRQRAHQVSWSAASVAGARPSSLSIEIPRCSACAAINARWWTVWWKTYRSSRDPVDSKAVSG